MFNLVFAGLFFVIGLLCFIPYKYYKKQHSSSNWWFGWGVFFYIISGCFVIVLFIVQLTLYTNQLNDFENLKKFNELETIYQNKADDLTSQFAKYLYEAYPDYEKEIFQNISPEKVDFYLVKYPELKSSETILALTSKINGLQSDYYQQKINKAEFKKDVRFRKKNPWGIGRLIPSLPGNLQ